MGGTSSSDPPGLFGIAVTTGLLAYELFGIKKCHALLVAGQDLEKEMDLLLPEGLASSTASTRIVDNANR